MKETWKDIPGYEGLYQISNLGRVKSLARRIDHKFTGFSTYKERILKQNLSNTNKYGGVFPRVRLSKNGKARVIYPNKLKKLLFDTNV
jgi:hypothetical protein